MRSLLVASVSLCLLASGSARSAPNLDSMTPEQVVRVLLKLDAMTDKTKGSDAWTKEPAYSRLFTKSYRHDRDLMGSVEGNWWDADELTGSQEGSFWLTKVVSTEHPSADKAIVNVEYALGQPGTSEYESYPKDLKASFALIKEDGVWKIDELTNASGPNHATYKQLTEGCFDCMGGGDHVDWVIQYFYTRVPICNNDGYDDRVRQEACDTIKRIAAKLTAHDYCFGKKGQAGYEMVWDKCGPDSIRSPSR